MDNIPVEVWKAGVLNDELLHVCNQTLNGKKPSIWSKSIIITIPKKGELGIPKNYRGISLTYIAAKIYNRILLHRIEYPIENILRDNHNGFRAGRSTIGHILALRRLMEGIKAENLTAVLSFIDFRQPFDSIHRKKMLKILMAYGIPGKIVNAIAIMYDNTLAKVRSPDGDTDFLMVLSGVLQGDTLAPLLFVIVLDYALRISIDTKLGFTVTPRRSRRYPVVKIADTDYPDEIALLSDLLMNAQFLLKRVEEAAKELCLYINPKKTEFTAFGEVGDVKTPGNANIKKVLNFLYLGAWIGSSSSDIKVQKAKAWSALNKMDVIWKSSMNRNLKIRFFGATVESVLLYGAETSTLNRKLTN